MGLLDIVGSVMGNTGGASADPKAQLLQAAMSLLQQQGGSGGLAGLVQQFESGGLGNIVQSWISTGANLPISAEQIQSILGHGTLGSLAQQTGLSSETVSSHLSELLPGLVDKLTPQGQVPSGGLDLGHAASLLSGLLGK